MPLEPRLQTKDLVLSVPEYQQRTPQEGTVRTVTPTTMTTTTIVSSQLTSAYVGFYVIPEDGSGLLGGHSLRCQHDGRYDAAPLAAV